jgi:hypothetical protein
MIKRIILFSSLLLTACLLSADFDIEKFTDPAKYGWDSLENYNQAREEIMLKRNIIHFYEMKKSSLYTNVLRSAVFPGWGHFAVRQYTRGEILLGLEVIFLGTAFYYYNQAMEDYDKYREADFIVDINTYYDRAQDKYRVSQTFLALGLLTWLYSMYDTVLVTQQYNSKLWDELNKKYLGDQLEIGLSTYPLGLKVRF